MRMYATDYLPRRLRACAVMHSIGLRWLHATSLAGSSRIASKKAVFASAHRFVSSSTRSRL